MLNAALTHNEYGFRVYLEVEDIKKKIDKEFYLDIKEEYFEGREKIRKREDFYEMKKKIGQEIETEPVNSDLLCRMFDV